MADTVVQFAGGAAILAVGVVAGALLFGSAREGAPAASPSGSTQPAEISAAPVEVPTAAREAHEAQVQGLREEVRTLEDDRSGLNERVTTLDKELQEARAELATLREEAASATAAEAAEERADDPAIAFGDDSHLDAIRNADWAELGGAVYRMTGLVKDVLAFEPGDPAAMKVQIEIAKENSKLQKLAFEANGKLPTHASGNGEYTHPLVLANLLDQHLAAAGDPLDGVQRADAAGLGELYAREWGQTQRGYHEETVALQKLIDELELKKRFTDRLEGILSASQLELLNASGVRHLFMLDLHSPVLMLAGRADVLARGSVEEIGPAAIAKAAVHFGFFEEDLAALPGIFDDWMRAVEARLSPVSKERRLFFHIDDALVAGRAQVAIQEQLLQLAPSDEVRAQILNAGTVIIPRLIGEE